MAQNPYTIGLEKKVANFTPLSPLSLFARTASMYQAHSAVVHGDIRLTWADVYTRSCRPASALQQRGVGEGDTVAVSASGTSRLACKVSAKPFCFRCWRWSWRNFRSR